MFVGSFYSFFAVCLSAQQRQHDKVFLCTTTTYYYYISLKNNSVFSHFPFLWNDLIMPYNETNFLNWESSEFYLALPTLHKFVCVFSGCGRCYQQNSPHTSVSLRFQCLRHRHEKVIRSRSIFSHYVFWECQSLAQRLLFTFFFFWQCVI